MPAVNSRTIRTGDLGQVLSGTMGSRTGAILAEAPTRATRLEGGTKLKKRRPGFIGFYIFRLY